MAMVMGCFLAPSLSIAEDEAAVQKEYVVKVAFLYNFVKFVTWPGAQSLAQTHVANICIIGSNPFGSALDLFKKVSTPQLMLEVKKDISISDIPGCNILFVSKSEEENVSPIIEHAQNHPVLTVSGIKDFADKGGIIEMVKVEQNIGLFSKDKINLRINLKAANKEHLEIDPQLLEIAAEVMK